MLSGYTVEYQSIPVPRQQRRLLKDAQWAPEGVYVRLWKRTSGRHALYSLPILLECPVAVFCHIGGHATVLFKNKPIKIYMYYIILFTFKKEASVSE